MKKLVFSALLIAGVIAAACTNTPGHPTVSFTSPVASGPSNGASYKFKAQPVTISITNAVRTGAATATYNLEVASDSAFTNKVVNTTGIAEGSGGTTSVTLSSLPATSGNVTYYWRTFSVVDGVTSAASATQTFVVQQQISVSAPSLSAPSSGATTSELRPTFVTTNASRQGAVGTITYVFQVSTASNFSTISAEKTVTEGSGGQTSWTPTSDLPTGTLYWRVQARDDANTETSGFSSTRSFVLEPFDPKKAVFHHNFSDIATWPETAKITSITFTNDMLVDFDRRTGSNKWPEVGDANFGPLQYTLGMCFNLSGTWHCSAAIQFWEGRDLGESGPWRDIARNWYYDPGRWGEMAGYQPEVGELVAVWVGQGNLRGTGGNTRAERSNFQLIKFGTNYP